MTKLARGGIFFAFRPVLVGAAGAVALLSLQGCVSTDTGPLVTAPASGLSSGAVKNTGTYPNLNIAPQVAASQISEPERKAKLSELSAAQAGQSAAGGAATPNDEALLRKLAATHGQKTLEEIESK